MRFVIPLMFVVVFLFALVKKKNVYSLFVEGGQGAFSLAVGLLPYLSAVLVLVNLLQESGLLSKIIDFVSPPFVAVGIPKELVHLTLLRPFSGSGSLAILNDVYKTYGVDGYVARCASVLMGSTETVFYISAVYFANTKVKSTGLALPIALGCTFLSCILTCLLCKVM
ncbi:MAG: spore maturation protein [Clostridia bacterium]|nr:spore maturation protein [Clostridia bacterium]